MPVCLPTQKRKELEEPAVETDELQSPSVPRLLANEEETLEVRDTGSGLQFVGGDNNLEPV